MASAKLLELGALLHLTAMQHGHTADLIRANAPLELGLIAESLDELADKLNEISDMISDGQYDE